MSDILTKKQRSVLMGRIRGKSNKGTEGILASLLRSYRISGWRRHLPLPGTPDFALKSDKIAIFVDGCFWHGCRRCSRNLTPATNREFWSDKFDANRRRDRRATQKLRRLGWRVIRIWEHDLKKRPDVCIERIRGAIA